MMSNPRRSPPAPEKAELETVTDWRMIAAGAGLLLAFLAVPLAVSLFTVTRPAVPRAVAAVKPQRPPLVDAPPPVTTVTLIRPQLSYPQPEPFPVRKAPRPTPPVVARAAAPAPARPVAAATVSRQTTRVAEAPGFRRRWGPQGMRLPELLAVLKDIVPEVSLDSEPGTSKLLARSTDTAHPVLELLPRRSDLAGLPALGASECRASEDRAKLLQFLSRDVAKWRPLLGTSAARSGSQSALGDGTRWVAGDLDQHAVWKREEAVSTLEQVLQSEPPPIRFLLVKQLATIPGPVAGAALARRAIFDVSEELRESAVEAMKARPRAEVRPTLLAALRYPWAPAADHAAEALVNLDDKAAAAPLVRLLDLPDPEAPAFDAGKKNWVVSELVRVNHLGNCLLCHAPSAGRQDPVRGPVPEPGKPLPVVYYQQSRGSFVRADTTYLRQDFSVPQPVEKAAPWPEFQRFDYLVRKREVPDAEGAARAAEARGRDYPQRGAVLFALRELTGADAGERAADWSLLLLRKGAVPFQ